MYEASQDIKLGNAGDIHTKAKNPVRDTLFMGNDKLYHDVGNIFVTGSAIMIPIGQTQSVVKGLTQFAIGEAGAYTAGQVAYHGTKLLGGSEEDAQTANFIGNIVGGYAASSAASKFSLNKVKVDVEAPKYNREQILKNLEESRLARESSNFDQYLAKEKFQKTLMSMEPMDRQRYLQWHEYAESGIMVQDRVKLLSWERPVNSKLYLENKAVYDNPKYFDQLTGNENWPGQKGDPNIDGFVKGEYQKTTLSPGDKIDRFGSDYGHFFGNIGESKEMRAMSPNSDFKNYNQYEILMDLPVLKGKIAPWFNQPGGGIQFKLDPFFAKQIMSIPSDEAAIIKKLIEFGYLRKL